MSYAIFVDIDGTLLDFKGTISKSAKMAIRQARKNGHYVFLNTGRCKAEISASILDVGFDGIIASGGGYIEYQGKSIRHLTFKDEDITELRQYFSQNEIGYYLECNHGMYVDSIFKNWMDEAFKAYVSEDSLEFTMVNDTQKIDEVNKISFLCLRNNYDQIYADLHEKFDVIKNTFPMIRNEAGEISLKGIHKADAMDILLKEMGLNHLKTIALGDSDNDIEMLKHANIGICMGNGTKACKLVCDEITDDVEHDGLYKSFLKYHLI